jgi:hypothetical protein
LQREPPPIAFGCLSRLGNLAFEHWHAQGAIASTATFVLRKCIHDLLEIQRTFVHGEGRVLGLFARLPGVTKGAQPFVSTT